MYILHYYVHLFTITVDKHIHARLHRHSQRRCRGFRCSSRLPFPPRLWLKYQANLLSLRA